MPARSLRRYCGALALAAALVLGPAVAFAATASPAPAAKPHTLTVPPKPATKSVPTRPATAKKPAPKAGAATTVRKPTPKTPTAKKSTAAKKTTAKTTTAKKPAPKKSTAKTTATKKTTTRKPAAKKATAPTTKSGQVPAKGRNTGGDPGGKTGQAAAQGAYGATGVRHYKPSSPILEPDGDLYLGATVARFVGRNGVMNLERGPVLTATQSDWLAGMTAYRVINWATYRQANPQGPCGHDPVRWIAIRRTPPTSPDKPAPDAIDVALLSERDIARFRPDNPTLCQFSTYFGDRPAPAAKAKPAAKARAKKTHKAPAKKTQRHRPRT